MFEANSGTVKNEIERLREIEYKVALEQYLEISVPKTYCYNSSENIN